MYRDLNFAAPDKAHILDTAFIKYCVSMLCALAAATCLYPTSVHAQVPHPCGGGGPGPGQRVVGRIPPSNGLGEVLLCAYTNEPQSQQAPQQQEPPPRPRIATYATDNFYAIAWHGESRHFWGSYDYPVEDDAIKEAMAACNKVMGSGCSVAVSGKNGVVAVHERIDGALVYTVSHDGLPNLQLYQNCGAIGKTCHLVKKIFANQKITAVGNRPEFGKFHTAPAPSDGESRKRYGSIAWMGAESTHPLGNKIWVSTGHQTRPDAEKAALALCGKSAVDAATACKTAITMSTGVMTVWQDKENKIRIDSDVFQPFTFDRYSAICKQQQPKCTFKYLFETAKPGESVHDLR
jgi:Domain of unknown function (DUF4189)